MKWNRVLSVGSMGFLEFADMLLKLLLIRYNRSEGVNHSISMKKSGITVYKPKWKDEYRNIISSMESMSKSKDIIA